MGRGPGPAQCLRAGLRGGADNRKIELLTYAFRQPAFQTLVRCRNLSRIGAAEGHGMSGAGTLRGSFLCA